MADVCIALVSLSLVPVSEVNSSLMYFQTMSWFLAGLTMPALIQTLLSHFYWSLHQNLMSCEVDTAFPRQNQCSMT
jgi:hypothetical protein